MYQKLKDHTLFSLGFKDKDQPEDISASYHWDNYALTTKKGRQFYSLLSDELLLSVLRLHAKTTGYSPSQRDLFWVWKVYIKNRFKNWPSALQKAGLPKSAGKNGQTLKRNNQLERRTDELLEQVKMEAIRLGRLPHPKDLPDVCSELKNRIPNWSEVLKKAQINNQFLSNNTTYKIADLENEYIEMLQEVKQLVLTLNRAPLHNEIETDLKKRLIRRCGSWRNVLHQLDLEPVVRIHPFSSTSIKKANNKNRNHRISLHDCCYKVLQVDDQDQSRLDWLYQLSISLGRTPSKKDVPPHIRKQLNKTFGSWINTLYQLGITHLNETVE